MSVCGDVFLFPRCCSDIVDGVEQLLQHVSSVKALASIKSAVHSLLSTPSEPAHDDDTGDCTQSHGDDTHWAEHWGQVCSLILDKELNIWKTFLGPPLLKRVQVLPH